MLSIRVKVLLLPSIVSVLTRGEHLCSVTPQILKLFSYWSDFYTV